MWAIPERSRPLFLPLPPAFIRACPTQFLRPCRQRYICACPCLNSLPAAHPHFCLCPRFLSALLCFCCACPFASSWPPPTFCPCPRVFNPRCSASALPAHLPTVFHLPNLPNLSNLSNLPPPPPTPAKKKRAPSKFCKALSFELSGGGPKTLQPTICSPQRRCRC